MRRHNPGTIIWTADRLACLYQSWKERHGHQAPNQVSRAERQKFESDWSAWMTKRTGGAVSPSAVQMQLRHGFSLQTKISRNHFWTYASNRSARLHVGVRVGPAYDHEWPEKLTVTYKRSVKK